MSDKHKVPLAVAEATGGAIGAFWTTLLFYPIDVAKIRLQAEADADEENERERSQQEDPSQHEKPANPPPKKAKTFLGEILLVLKEPDLWYAGLGTKLQLAVISTFIYFYVYTLLKRGYSRILKAPVGLLSNLLLASLAGIANVLVTMPLDVIVTRLQVAPRGHRRSLFNMARLVYAEGITRLWQGLVPAIILTSNPAINYAAYDFLKTLVRIQPGKERHDTRQILLIGMLSKFIATLITYPLIRAKVIMMAGTKEEAAAGGKKDKGDDSSSSLSLVEKGEAATQVDGGSVGGREEKSSSLPSLPHHHVHQGPGLIETMSDLLQEGGIGNLYVGLDAQVFNTALKSGVLLNTKEQVSRITSFLIRRLVAR